MNRPKMNLGIFAHHVSSIFSQPCGHTVTYYPCEGVVAKVTVDGTDHEDKVWDTVIINGKACGNRHGGVKAFVNMIVMVNPEIEAGELDRHFLVPLVPMFAPESVAMDVDQTFVARRLVS